MNFDFSQSQSSCTRRALAGLTLIELMLVLVILAAISLVALESTTGVVDQSRFDSSIKTLENTGRAIIKSDEAGQVSGYLIDMGELPENLNDLITQPSGVIDFGLRDIDLNNDGEPEFQMPSGWRGPYLRLPVGVDAVQDSWGTLIATNLEDDDFDPDADDLLLRSFGADLLAGDGDGNYQQDLDLILTAQMRLGVLSYGFEVTDNNTTIGGNPRLALIRFFPDGTNLDGFGFNAIYNAVTTNGAIHPLQPKTPPYTSAELFGELTGQFTQAPGLSVFVLVKWDDADTEGDLDPTETMRIVSVMPYLLKPQTTLSLNKTLEITN